MINFQNNKYDGFTIMEVLLALVISCIVMVASVPIITVQKNYGHIEKWNRTKNGADVFYGTPTDSLKVGIGTTTPRVRLHVRGYDDDPDRPVMTLRAGDSDGIQAANFVFANSELEEIGRLGVTTGNNEGSIAIGVGAANNMGIDAPANVSPLRSVAIGVNAMRNMRNAADNVVIGGMSYSRALMTRGHIIIGGNIARNLALNDEDIGRRNYILSNHFLNTIGNRALRNILIGADAGATTVLEGDNICIGRNACTRGSNRTSVIIGNNVSGVLNTEGADRVVIGSYAIVNIIGNFISRFNLVNDPNAPYNKELDDGIIHTLWGQLVASSIISTPKGRIVGGVIDISNDITTIRQADVEANTINTPTNLREFEFSDKRYKNVVGEYKKSIDDLEKISIYRFKYKSDGANGLESSGVIAQEIKSIFPDAVTTRGEKNIHMVNYDYINMATLNAVKDLQKRNKELRLRVEKLKKIVSESQSCTCQ